MTRFLSVRDAERQAFADANQLNSWNLLESTGKSPNKALDLLGGQIRLRLEQDDVGNHLSVFRSLGRLWASRVPLFEARALLISGELEPFSRILVFASGP